MGYKRTFCWQWEEMEGLKAVHSFMDKGIEYLYRLKLKALLAFVKDGTGGAGTAPAFQIFLTASSVSFYTPNLVRHSE